MSELSSFILDEDAFKSKARLTSLYSDFSRLRTTNPDGYRANVSAWSSALSRATRAGVTPSSNLLSLHTGSDLSSELEVRGLGRPVALDTVFDEAVRNGDMIPLQDFLNSTQTIYKKPSWLPKLYIPSAWEVAQWSLRQIGIAGSTSLRDADLVIKANVEAASQAVLKQLSSTLNPTTPSTTIYSLPTFTHAFSTILSTTHLLTPTDIPILLKHLSRDLSACTTDSPTTPNPTYTIKFRPPNSTTPTQRDTTLAHLSSLHLALTTECNTLTTRLSTLTTQLTPLVPHTTTSPIAKTTALSVLRRRRALDATLQKRQSSLASIEATQSSIDDAASNIEIMAAMQSSSEVLAELNRQVGGVEGVDRVMDGVREERERLDEISGVIIEGGAEGVDEGEVEGELEELMREEEG